jgi:hypothetical protein
MATKITNSEQTTLNTLDLDAAIAAAVCQRDLQRDVERARDAAERAEEMRRVLSTFQRSVEPNIPAELRVTLNWRYALASSKGRDIWWPDMQAIALFSDPCAPHIELALERSAAFATWRVIRPDQDNFDWLNYVLAETSSAEDLASAILLGLHDFRIRFVDEIQDTHAGASQANETNE